MFLLSVGSKTVENKAIAWKLDALPSCRYAGLAMLGQRMEHEIREQTGLLSAHSQRYFDELSAFASPLDIELVVLAARGSSDNAAHYLRYLIEVFWGIPVVLAAPSVLTVFHREVRYPPSLCIGISQSGAAPDVAAVLGAMRNAGHRTLAITNTIGSACEDAAESCLHLNIGEEKSVAATKTFSSTLLACYQLARSRCESLPVPKLPDEEFLLNARSYAHDVAGLVSDANVVFSLGRGFSFCSAQECALKLMECALVGCKAYSTADFEHGPKALLADDAISIVFGNAPSSLREAGAKQINALGSHEVWGPIWDAIFSQWLALSVARLRGLDPDAPAFLKKVTKTV